MTTVVISAGQRGLSLSINSIAIITLSLVTFIVWLLTLYRRTVIITHSLILFALGACILAIPLLYTTSAWFGEAGWRTAGLVAGVLFYFSCLQIRYSRSVLNTAFGALLLLVCIQTLLALLQMFAPTWAWVPLYSRRIYGSFLQPNVFASFIATGLALVLMHFLLPKFVMRKVRHERCRLAGLGLMLMVLTALLLCIQSRTGWLGGGAVGGLFLWCFGRTFPTRSIIAGSLMLFGIILGGGVLWSDLVIAEAVNHIGSNNARWSMLRDTLAMISERPFLGWGYGGYEYSFQHFRINQTPPTVITEISRHPHNEILLWVVEGGIVGMLGVGVILTAILSVVCQSIRRDRVALALGTRSAGLLTALCIMLVPIAIHTQLEYPFYISTIHFVVFLWILAMADRIGRRGCRVSSPVIGMIVSVWMSILAIVATVIMGFTLSGVITINRVEHKALVDITPIKTMHSLSFLAHQERKTFDEQVHALLTYNDTRDEQVLDNYSQWAKNYLEMRIDKNVYASLIQILQHQGQTAQSEQYRRDAAFLFPEDKRFIKFD